MLFAITASIVLVCGFAWTGWFASRPLARLPRTSSRLEPRLIIADLFSLIAMLALFLGFVTAIARSAFAGSVSRAVPFALFASFPLLAIAWVQWGELNEKGIHDGLRRIVHFCVWLPLTAVTSVALGFSGFFVVLRTRFPEPRYDADPVWPGFDLVYPLIGLAFALSLGLRWLGAWIARPRPVQPAGVEPQTDSFVDD